MVVSPIILTCSLYDVKLFLSLATFEVVESHVIRFCSFWDHGFYQSLGCRVICGDLCGALRIAHFHQSDLQRDSYLAVVESAAFSASGAKFCCQVLCSI